MYIDDNIIEPLKYAVGVAGGLVMSYGAYMLSRGKSVASFEALNTLVRDAKVEFERGTEAMVSNQREVGRLMEKTEYILREMQSMEAANNSATSKTSSRLRELDGKVEALINVVHDMAAAVARRDNPTAPLPNVRQMVTRPGRLITDPGE